MPTPVPFNRVPLVEPRSLTTNSSPTRRIAQCRRETALWSMTTSAFSPRPITSSCMCGGMEMATMSAWRGSRRRLSSGCVCRTRPALPIPRPPRPVSGRCLLASTSARFQEASTGGDETLQRLSPRGGCEPDRNHPGVGVRDVGSSDPANCQATIGHPTSPIRQLLGSGGCIGEKVFGAVLHRLPIAVGQGNLELARDGHLIARRVEPGTSDLADDQAFQGAEARCGEMIGNPARQHGHQSAQGCGWGDESVPGELKDQEPSGADDGQKQDNRQHRWFPLRGLKGSTSHAVARGRDEV